MELNLDLAKVRRIVKIYKFIPLRGRTRKLLYQTWQDWLAMYDLLKEIADDRPTCDGEINQLVKRIRALIGGE